MFGWGYSKYQRQQKAVQIAQIASYKSQWRESNGSTKRFFDGLRAEAFTLELQRHTEALNEPVYFEDAFLEEIVRADSAYVVTFDLVLSDLHSFPSAQLRLVCNDTQAMKLLSLKPLELGEVVIAKVTELRTEEYRMTLEGAFSAALFKDSDEQWVTIN